jgi:hypothetical protein
MIPIFLAEPPIIIFLRLSWRNMAMFMLPGLSGRYSAMTWGRVIAIASRRPLCDADTGSGKEKNACNGDRADITPL